MLYTNKLLTLIFIGLLFLACDPPEDNSSSSGGVTRIDITDAQSLVVVPASSLNSDSSLAAGFAVTAFGTEQKILAKIKKDGTVVQVPIENPDSQLKSSSVPQKIIPVNDDYLIIHFGDGASNYYYLVRKNDGAMFDLDINFGHSIIGYATIGNVPVVYTDKYKNIYYGVYRDGVYRGKGIIYKVNVSNSADPTKQAWTPQGYNVKDFVVDSEGNVLFSKAMERNQGIIKVASSGKIQDIRLYGMYLDLDGQIHYLREDDLNPGGPTSKEVVLSQTNLDKDGYLEFKAHSSPFSHTYSLYTPNVGILIYLENYVIHLPTEGNLGSWVGLYAKSSKGGSKLGTKTITQLSGKQLKSDSGDSSNPIQVSKDRFYVLSKNSGIYRVDVANGYTTTQIFDSSNYNVYKMAVSTDAKGDDTLTFNAVDKNNSGTVTGLVTIAEDGNKGKVKFIKELNGAELTLLQRVN